MAKAQKAAETQAAETNTDKTTVTVFPEPTSEKLTQLRADKKAKWAEMRNIEDPESNEALEVKLAIFKIDNDIKAEVANIKKAEQDAITAELRNKKVQMSENLINAVLSAYGVDPATRTVENDAKFSTQNDAIKNELLSGRLSSPTAKTAGTGDGTKGATGKRIIDAFLANRAAGMNDTDNKKAIVESGESRGTTGAVVLAWQRANGEVK